MSEFGWDFDNTSDITRIIRVAGTQNHKSDPPKAVTIWDGYSADAGLVLSRAEFERVAADGAPRKAEKTARSISSSAMPSPPPGGGNSQPANFDSIIAGCDFIQHWVEDAETLTEPEWKAGIDIAAHCENGREIIHEASKPYPRYSAEETDGKVYRAKEIKPRTCRNIAEDVGHSGCATCPLRFTINSPIALGYRKVNLVKLARRYVYLSARDRFFDLESPE